MSSIYATANVNGLNKTDNFEFVLNYVELNKLDWIIITETHLTHVDTNLELIKKKYPNWNIINTVFTEKRNGVLLLSNKKTIEILEEVEIDNVNSELLIVNVKESSGDSYTIIGIYGLSVNNQKFKWWETITKKILQYKNRKRLLSKIIITGDFNFIENMTDTSSKTKVISKKLNKLWQSFCDKLNLTDIKPSNSKFTFQLRSNQNIRMRLDRFYIDKELANNCFSKISENKIKKENDHWPVLLTRNILERKGIIHWKCNMSLFDNHNIKTKTQDLIYTLIKSEKNWSNIKNKIKNSLKRSGKNAKKKENKKKKILIKMLGLYRNITEKDTSISMKDKLNKKIAKLEEELDMITNKEIESKRVQSRTQFDLEGEKTTKYYSNIIKKRSQINSIKVPEDETLKYFEDLFQEKDIDKDWNDFEKYIKIISEEDKENLDQEISIEEIEEAVRQAPKKSHQARMESQLNSIIYLILKII